MCFAVFQIWCLHCITGVATRQALLLPRLGERCPCQRCSEDLGRKTGGATGYGATGELVRCCDEACAGYVDFPNLEEANATAAPCPVCQKLLDFKGTPVRRSLGLAGMRLKGGGVPLRTHGATSVCTDRFCGLSWPTRV